MPKRVPQKISLLILFFISLNCFAQSIAHVRQIRKELYDDNSNEWFCSEQTTFTYLKGFLYSVTVEKSTSNYSGGDLNVNYGYNFYYDKTFRAQRVYSGLAKGADTLSEMERYVVSLNSDSLIGFLYRQKYYADDKKYYSTSKAPYFYFANYSMKGYETFEPDNSGGWKPWYRELADSTNKQKTKFFFQDLPEGVYKTSANEYFDSIRVTKNVLQFIFRSDDVSDKSSNYDKYVFNLDGSFKAYESWQHFPDEKNWRNDLIRTYENDEHGRPAESFLETPPIIEMGQVVEDISREHYTYSYVSDDALATSPLAINRKGNFLSTDWCLDPGDEIVMILIDKNMKINFYGTFPIGQPFMNISKMPKGEYYLCVFSRSAEIGAMTKLTL